MTRFKLPKITATFVVATVANAKILTVWRILLMYLKFNKATLTRRQYISFIFPFQRYKYHFATMSNKYSPTDNMQAYFPIIASMYSSVHLNKYYMTLKI